MILKTEKMSEKLTGSNFLRSNFVEMGPKELWQLYNVLKGIEEASGSGEDTTTGGATPLF